MGMIVPYPTCQIGSRSGRIVSYRIRSDHIISHRIISDRIGSDRIVPDRIGSNPIALSRAQARVPAGGGRAAAAGGTHAVALLQARASPTRARDHPPGTGNSKRKLTGNERNVASTRGAAGTVNSTVSTLR